MLNVSQALLIIDRWQRARSRKFGHAEEEPQQQNDVEGEQEPGLPHVNANRENAKRVREKTQEEIILNSYLRGATPERISKIGKIPLNIVREVIERRCLTT
jgi:DNA-directed RNA polymerase specialized sigma24 family protein